MIYSDHKVEIRAVSDCIVVLGTPPTQLKEGSDGYNHGDLSQGALLHFFSFPKQRIVRLKTGESMEIDAFVAYSIEKS